MNKKLIGVFGVCFAASLAGAQPATTPAPAVPPASPPTAPAVPVPVVLSDELYKLDEIGLVLQLPKGHKAETTQLNGVTTVQIYPEDRLYVVTVQMPMVTDEMQSVAQACEKIIDQFKGALGVFDAQTRQQLGSTAALLEPRKELRIPGSKQPGERFMCSIPRRDGTYVIQGYSIFKPLPNQFVIFELVCAESVLPRARPAYEVLVAAAKFEDPAVMIESRRKAVTGGIELLKKIDSAQLLAAMPTDQVWYRLYRPSRTGIEGDAEEGGYRSVRFWRGVRSEVGNKKEPASATNPEGILCEIDARLISRRPTAAGQPMEVQSVDSRAVYFLSMDRNEEMWSVLMVMPDPRAKQARSYRETGARSGKSLTISLNLPAEPPKTIKPLLQGEGYLSQVEAQLLHSLLILNKVEGEIGFYSYRTDSQSIVLRRDVVTRDPKGRDMLGIATRFREEPEPQKSAYDADGRLLRAELPDGRVWEPITPAELFKLYKSKGLPTGEAR